MISRENAEHYPWGTNCHGWHLVKSARLSVIQELIPPGAEETRHYHTRSEQFFFVLKGIATLEVGGVVHELSEEQGLHVPAALPHQMMNRSQSDVHFLVISTPPSHGDRTNVQQSGEQEEASPPQLT